MIPELPEAQNVLVVGPVASGKTFLLNKWWTLAPRVLLFDGAGEIDDDDRRFVHAYTPSELRYDLIHRPNARYHFVYHAQKPAPEFPAILTEFWQLGEARHLFVDEVQEISELDETDTALRFARKRLLGIVGATQRLADTTTTYRANARMVVLFFTHEGNDLDAIRESWGSDVQEAVTQLRPLIYDDVNKRVVQTPQALVYRRGMPHEVIELG